MVVNNRLDKNKLTGDFSTPEQKIPDTGIPGKDWETCMTMNSTWGYKSFDHSWKPTERLIRNLIDIASKGLSAPVESATLLADQKKLEGEEFGGGGGGNGSDICAGSNFIHDCFESKGEVGGAVV